MTKKFLFFWFISSLNCYLLHAQETNLDWKIHDVGKVRQVILNTGSLTAAINNEKYNYPYLINSEFPPNSNEEHLYISGLWIGAVNSDGDTLMSLTKPHFGFDEFYPTAEPYDSVWVVYKGDTVDIPYWSQYTATSDQDFVCRYNDYTILNIENHNPLYLDVIQRSYAWSSPPLDEFILLQYDLIPVQNPISDLYIAYWQQGEVGNNNIGDNWIDEYTLFFPEEQMGVTLDAPGGNDGTAFSPIGIKVLSPVDDELNWSYLYYTHEDLFAIGRDPARYRKISSGVKDPDYTEPARSHFTIAFGPIDYVAVGDTFHFEIALVFGEGMDGMMDNAKYLEFLATRDYKVPSPPPKPIMQVTKKSHEIHLDWYPQDDAHNPELYEDPYRGDNEPQPFEGYRLYKSTQSSTGPWTLLAEFDVPDNSHGFNTGLEYNYIDFGLLDNFEYYYTITAFSKPDSTTLFPSQESSLNNNSIRVVPGTPPPKTVGNVAVVPNPYRGDIAYQAFNPPWEKVPRGRDWMEQDRRIQFINLPYHCEIKIYTLSGNLVNTLQHRNYEEGYEDWNLTSYVGQAVASGIYLFTVEDLNTGDVQIGKFVIIK